jgi:hypothetical protein
MAGRAWWTLALSLSLFSMPVTKHVNFFGGLLLYSTDTPDLSCEPFLLLLLLLFPMGLIIQRKKNHLLVRRSCDLWMACVCRLTSPRYAPPSYYIYMSKYQWLKHWNRRIARDWAWLSRPERKIKEKIRQGEMPSIDARRMFDMLIGGVEKGRNLGGLPTWCVHVQETSLHSI